jgi:protein SCO1/2
MKTRVLAFFFLAFTASLSAQDFLNMTGKPPALRKVRIEQRLNIQIPLETQFRDESGRTVALSDYFGRKPVILALVYYQCPMLCTQILNGLTGSLKALSFDAGNEFEVLAVSFDPKDTPETAAAKKANYVRRYGRKGAENGWHFLSGEERSIRSLTEAVGFHYAYDPATQQYAHASAIMILTPQGKTSRYFYGVEYAPRDVKLGLMEASQNKIGSPVDQAMLYCYQYDPTTGKYGPVVMNIVRLSGAATLLVLGTALIIFWRRELARNKARVTVTS